MIFNKKKIKKSIKILHKCDVPGCVNPNHLFEGTQLENMQDMRRKGREYKVKGESCGSAKLSNEDVKIIKTTLLNRGASMKEIANSFNVSTSAIRCIKDNKTWKHI